MKKYLFIAIFFITLVMSGLYCAPYYAVNKLQKAAMEGDYTTLNSYIDYEKIYTATDKYTETSSNINKESIARILQQSMIAPRSENESDRLEMTMGFSGDDHFMLSFEPVTQKTTDGKIQGPIIFVLEKDSIFHWHVTEIVFSD